MTPTPEHRDTDFDRERDPHRFQAVYLVKRPGYEFVYYSPTAPAAYLDGEQAFVRVRFPDRHQGQAHVLELEVLLEVLEDFYESLSRLMEYLNIERQKSAGTSQVG
jgi:hypothetical protein